MFDWGVLKHRVGLVGNTLAIKEDLCSNTVTSRYIVAWTATTIASYF